MAPRKRAAPRPKVETLEKYSVWIGNSAYTIFKVKTSTGLIRYKHQGSALFRSKEAAERALKRYVGK